MHEDPKESARSSAFAARASNTTARAYASGIRMPPLLLWCWLQLSFSVCVTYQPYKLVSHLKAQNILCLGKGETNISLN